MESTNVMYLLTNNNYNNWHLYQFKTVTNPVIVYDNCIADDVWSFYNNGKIAVNPNGTRCSAAVDSTTIRFLTWKLNSTNDSISWVPDSNVGFMVNYKIRKITATDLELIRNAQMVDSNGSPIGREEEVQYFVAM